MSRLGIASVAVLGLSAALVAGCAASSGGPAEAYTAPSAEQFGVVARSLDAHCGTLDCHGSSYRNLRLFGWSGRRFAAHDLPGGAPTTAKEVAADYCALIGLEPELLARVTDEGGRDADRLVLVRKMHGDEQHEGGVVFEPGSAGDHCVAAWLGADLPTQLSACEQSLDDLNGEPPEADVAVDFSACNVPAESLR